MAAPLVDLAPVLDRHGPEATGAWFSRHLQAVTLQIGTGAVAHDEHAGDRLLLERIVMHLVADSLTAPQLHARWQETSEPLALEGYGATQGVIRVTSELLDEYADPAVLDHVQQRLQTLVDELAVCDELPERAPAL